MTIKVAYNQIIRYENQFPNKLPKIDKITRICETRESSVLPKTTDKIEFMKRIPKYTFNIYLKNTDPTALPVYVYTFSKKEDAKKARKYCIDKWVDEQLEPYRKQIQKNKILSLKQLEECEKIQNFYTEED